MQRQQQRQQLHQQLQGLRQRQEQQQLEWQGHPERQEQRVQRDRELEHKSFQRFGVLFGLRRKGFHQVYKQRLIIKIYDMQSYLRECSMREGNLQFRLKYYFGGIQFEQTHNG